MALGSNIEYKARALFQAALDEKSAKQVEDRFIKLSKEASEMSRNEFVAAFSSLGKEINTALAKLKISPIDMEKIIQLPNAQMFSQLGSEFSTKFAEGFKSGALSNVGANISSQLQALQTERDALLNRQNKLQKGRSRVDYLTELPELASENKIKPFSSKEVEHFGSNIDEAALKIQENFTKAEDRLAKMKRGTMEYQQALIQAYTAASHLYRMEGYINQNRNKVQDKFILSDYDSGVLADTTDDLFSNYHKDFRKVGSTYYEPMLQQVSGKLAEIDGQIKQIQQNNPDIINQQSVGAGIKTLNEVEEAYKRILNAHGKVGKQGSNIQNALNFDPTTSKQGIKSLYDAYTKMPEDSPWEVQYQALLKYVKLYESYLTSANNTHRKKTEDPQFKALYEQLKPMATNAQNMLQNVLNMANGVPLVGTSDVVTENGVESSQRVTIEAQKKAEAEAKARTEAEAKVKAEKEAAALAQRQRTEAEAAAEAMRREAEAAERAVKAMFETKHTTGSILNNPMFADMFKKTDDETEKRRATNESVVQVAEKELNVEKQTTAELEKQQKLLLYRRVDGQFDPNRISNRSVDALYNKQNQPTIQDALEMNFGGFGDGLYGSVLGSANDLIPFVGGGQSSWIEFDASGYNLFINKTVEQAQALQSFLLSLQKFVGKGTLLDTSTLTNITDLSNDQLFESAQKIFANFSMTKQEFDAWLENARKESEMIAQMFNKGQVPENRHNFGTRFMKTLGYDGVLNATGDEEYDGNTEGSVIYDPDADKIKKSVRVFNNEKEFAQHIHAEMLARQQNTNAINNENQAQEHLNQVERQNPPAQDDTGIHNGNAEAIEKEAQAAQKLNAFEISKLYSAAKYPDIHQGELEGALQTNPNLMSDLMAYSDTLQQQMQPVNDMASRISKMSSIKGIPFENLYQEAANVSKQLSTMYDDGIRDTEEYVALQYKLINIFEKLASSYSGVKGSGARDRSHLYQMIGDSVYQRTGYNPMDSSAVDAIWGQDIYSIAKTPNQMFGIRELSANILASDGNFKDDLGSLIFKDNKNTLSEINFVIEALSKISPTANTAKQSVDELNNSLQTKNAIESTDNDGAEVAEENAKTEALKQQNNALQENINLKGQANGQGVVASTGTGIGGTPTQTAPHGETSGEVTNLESVRSKVAEVTAAVNTKTQAFFTEQSAVKRVAQSEVHALGEVEKKITAIRVALNNIQTKPINIQISAPTEGQISGITSGVEVSQLESVRSKIAEIITAVNVKNKAFVQEQQIVTSAVGKENAALIQLKNNIDNVSASLTNTTTGLQQMKQGTKLPQQGNISTETQKLQTLKNKVAEVTKVIDTKTKAFLREETVVRQGVGKEVAALTQMETRLQNVVALLQQVQTLSGNTLNVRVNNQGNTGGNNNNGTRNPSDEGNVREQERLVNQWVSLVDRMTVLRAQIDSGAFDEMTTTRLMREYENLNAQVDRIRANIQTTNDVWNRVGNAYVDGSDTANTTMGANALPGLAELYQQLGVAQANFESKQTSASETAVRQIREKIDGQTKSLQLSSEELAILQQISIVAHRNQTEMLQSGAKDARIKEWQGLTSRLESLNTQINSGEFDEAAVRAMKAEVDLINSRIDELRPLIDMAEYNWNAMGGAVSKGRQQGEDAILKQQVKNFKQQVKDSQKEAGLTKSSSVATKAETALTNAMGLEGISPEQIVTLEQYQGKINTLKASIQSIRNQGGPVTDAQKQQLMAQTVEVDRYTKEIQELIANYERLSGPNASVLGSTQLSAGAGTDAIKKELTDVVMATTQGKASIKSFNAETNTLTYTLRTGKGEFTQYTASVRQADGALVSVRGTTTKAMGVFEALGQKIKQYSYYFTGSMMFYRVIAWVREGITAVKEIDSALTELKKVTDETEESYGRFLDTAAKTASKVGSTIKDVVSSTADWARLGYSMEDAHQMAESTQVLMNVSEFDDVSKATDSLISSIQAFKYTAEESMGVVDILNTIGNNYAISTADLATSLTKSSGSLVAANGTLEEAVALTATANTIIQDADVVGKMACRL